MGMNNVEDWLIKAVSLLLASYPLLVDFIASKAGSIPLLDIIQLFFEEEGRRQGLNQRKALSYLRSLGWEDLQKPNLEHYLLAGLAMYIALNYCFNHKYNKKEYIRWDIDYTDAYRAYLLREYQLGQIDDKTPPKTERIKPNLVFNLK